jgi:hypothetical protein
MSENNQDIKFNIYNPVITYDHRDAYDLIVSQLQEIFPICNQGKCKALEVSDDPQKQKQINDLMEKVEFFSKSLITITKKFFDQLYRAKEASAMANARSTSVIKMDMIERNLLERTCDVRWWALERAFWDCITLANRASDRVSKCHQSLKKTLVDTGDWGESLDPKLLQAIHGIEEVLAGKTNVLVNDHIREDFDQNVTRLLGHLKSQGEDVQVKALQDIQKSVNSLLESVSVACSRLEDIRNSYTLYRDLVIADREGIVIANSNADRRQDVLGKDVSSEDWFKKGSLTTDGTEYVVQDVFSSVVENEESLVYSTALRADGDEQGAVIGCMGVFFDFQGESQLILNEYLPKDSQGEYEEGWFSFFTDESGRVICSNDEFANPSGSLSTLPRNHCTISEPGQTLVSTSIVRGKKSLIVSHKTAGFDDYKGLGWISHFILPESAMFERVEEREDYGISSQELMSSHLIPEINKQTYKEIQRNKGDIQLISINGIVLATDLGKAGSSFIPIFDQITSTGNSTTGRMEGLLAEMSSDMLQQNFTALENFAKSAIDLIDRNLFERAADVRWWSSDHAFWEALQNPSEERFQEAAKRLGIINASYTMYRDLVIVDQMGKIVANSKSENRDRLSRTNVSDQSWFRESASATSSAQFAVQDVVNSELENEEASLIYSSGILENGQREGKSAGVLGIMFDWEDVAVPILKGCLPRINGEIIEGAVAFYVNSKDEIIGTTDSDTFPMGSKVDLPKRNSKLQVGESASGLLEAHGRRYIIGSSRTQGYREYKGLGWAAHVVRPII